MAELSIGGVREACGVFACVVNQGLGQEPITSSFDVAGCLYNGLIGLQHRGQESAGIVTSRGVSGDSFIHERGTGLVSKVFPEESLKQFKGSVLGIGHTRYSTFGSKDALNCIQPYVVYSVHGLLALAHNGELVNSTALRKDLLKRVGLSTDTDSEVLAQLLATARPVKDSPRPDWPAAIRDMMSRVTTAYSLAILTADAVYAVRDPWGNRPVCLGVIKGYAGEWLGKDEAWIVSSESCALQSVRADLIRDVEPGEIVEITPQDGIRSLGCFEPPGCKLSFCIFEYVYFSRADSVMEKRLINGKIKLGQQVYRVRYRCGQQLGREAPLDNADPTSCIVSTVPESATPAALGYAQEIKIPYTEVLCKSRYEGRTFIQPTDCLRRQGVLRKFAPLSGNYAGKRIVLIDDSIVRGNTMRPIVDLLKRTGAKEVHIRIASPPLRHPCMMGINIPTRNELIANQLNFPIDLKNGQNLPHFAEFLNADSVVYLSLDGLKYAVEEGIHEDRSSADRGYCTACLSGEYPVDIEDTVLPNGLHSTP